MGDYSILSSGVNVEKGRVILNTDMRPLLFPCLFPNPPKTCMPETFRNSLGTTQRTHPGPVLLGRQTYRPRNKWIKSWTFFMALPKKHTHFWGRCEILTNSKTLCEPHEATRKSLGFTHTSASSSGVTVRPQPMPFPAVATRPQVERWKMEVVCNIFWKLFVIPLWFLDHFKAPSRRYCWHSVDVKFYLYDLVTGLQGMFAVPWPYWCGGLWKSKVLPRQASASRPLTSLAIVLF